MDDARDVFKEFGEIRYATESKTKYFVRYAHQSEAVDAIMTYGEQYGVQPGINKEDEPWDPNNMEVFVGNIDIDISEKSFKEMFSTYEVEEFRFHQQGFSRFCFLAVKSLSKAIQVCQEMDGQEINGRPLRIRLGGEARRQSRSSEGNGKPENSKLIDVDSELLPQNSELMFHTEHGQETEIHEIERTEQQALIVENHSIPSKMDSVAEGQVIKIQVHELDTATHWWVVIEDSQDRDTLQKLHEDMSTYYDSMHPSLEYPRTELVAARFRTDAKWYRAWVYEKCPSSMVSVQYLDFGNMDTIPISWVHPLDSMFCILPAQAIEATVAGVELHDSQERQAMNYVAKLVENELMTVTVLKVEKDGLLIESPLSRLIVAKGFGTAVSSPVLNVNSSNNAANTPPRSPSRSTTTTGHLTIQTDMKISGYPGALDDKLLSPVFKGDASPVLGMDAMEDQPLMFDNLVQNRLQIDALYKVDLVDILEPPFITVQVKSDPNEQNLEKLSTSLNDLSVEHWESYVPKCVGEVVSARFSEDGIWYRAVIEELYPSTAKVRFIDYGGKDLLTFDQLGALAENLALIPVCGTRCRVEQIRSGKSHNNLQQQDVDAMSNLKIQVKKRDDDVYVVDLICPYSHKAYGELASLKEYIQPTQKRSAIVVFKEPENAKKVLDLGEIKHWGHTLTLAFRDDCVQLLFDGPLPMFQKSRPWNKSRGNRSRACTELHTRQDLSSSKSIKNNVLNQHSSSSQVANEVDGVSSSLASEVGNRFDSFKQNNNTALTSGSEKINASAYPIMYTDVRLRDSPQKFVENPAQNTAEETPIFTSIFASCLPEGKAKTEGKSSISMPTMPQSSIPVQSMEHRRPVIHIKPTQDIRDDTPVQSIFDTKNVEEPNKKVIADGGNNRGLLLIEQLDWNILDQEQADSDVIIESSDEESDN